MSISFLYGPPCLKGAVCPDGRLGDIPSLQAHPLGGRFVNRPYGETSVYTVGVGALDDPLVRHALVFAGRRGRRPLRGNGECTRGAHRAKLCHREPVLTLVWRSVFPDPRTGDADCHVGLRPPRNDTGETSVCIVGVGALDDPLVCLTPPTPSVSRLAGDGGCHLPRRGRQGSPLRGNGGLYCRGASRCARRRAEMPISRAKRRLRLLSFPLSRYRRWRARCSSQLSASSS